MLPKTKHKHTLRCYSTRHVQVLACVDQYRHGDRLINLPYPSTRIVAGSGLTTTAIENVYCQPRCLLDDYTTQGATMGSPGPFPRLLTVPDYSEQRRLGSTQYSSGCRRPSWRIVDTRRNWPSTERSNSFVHRASLPPFLSTDIYSSLTNCHVISLQWPTRADIDLFNDAKVGPPRTPAIHSTLLFTRIRNLPGCKCGTTK